MIGRFFDFHELEFDLFACGTPHAVLFDGTAEIWVDPDTPSDWHVEDVIIGGKSMRATMHFAGQRQLFERLSVAISKQFATEIDEMIYYDMGIIGRGPEYEHA